MQANTGAGALAANAVGAAGGTGGGAVGGGIPARGRRLAQHDGKDGKDGKDKGGSPPASPSGGSGECMSTLHSPLLTHWEPPFSTTQERQNTTDGAHLLHLQHSSAARSVCALP